METLSKMLEHSNVQQDGMTQLLSQVPFLSVGFMVAQPIFYMSSVFLLLRYMKDKQPMHSIRPFAKFHNLFMALYSLVSAVLTVWVSYRDGRFDSHDAFHCRPHRSIEYAWIMYAFYLSKIAEMIDTWVLVLLKKEVIWLHLLHHASTLSLVGTTFYGSVGHDFAPLFDNLVVHTFMYFYFAYPRALSSFRIVMTTTQIVQFCHVLYYSAVHAHMNYLGVNPCFETAPILYYTSFWYVVYLVMFINFFVQQYINKKSRPASGVAPVAKKKPAKAD